MVFTLKFFKQIYEQQINLYRKSELAYNGDVNESIKARILQILRIQELWEHKKYIRLPMCLSWSKNKCWSY